MHPLVRSKDDLRCLGDRSGASSSQEWLGSSRELNFTKIIPSFENWEPSKKTAETKIGFCSLRSSQYEKLYSGVQHSLWECKGVWWMPRLYKAMKDVEWLR